MAPIEFTLNLLNLSPFRERTLCTSYQFWLLYATDAGKHFISFDSCVFVCYFLVTVPPGILSHGKMSNQLGRMLQPSFIQKNDTENDTQAPRRAASHASRKLGSKWFPCILFCLLVALRCEAWKVQGGRNSPGLGGSLCSISGRMEVANPVDVARYYSMYARAGYNGNIGCVPWKYVS